MNTTKNSETANGWISFARNFYSFILALSALIFGWIPNLYDAYKYPGDYTSPAWRFYRHVTSCLAVLVTLYFTIGFVRFVGVAFTRDAGIRPETFFDWWWISVVRHIGKS